MSDDISCLRLIDSLTIINDIGGLDQKRIVAINHEGLSEEIEIQD
ncbi:MAG: hypothetical protein WCK29_00290 [archaeon]